MGVVADGQEDDDRPGARRALGRDDRPDWRWAATRVERRPARSSDVAAETVGSPTAGEVAQELGHVKISLNIFYLIFGGALVFFMQMGFAMVEVGFSRSKNAVHVVMTNFVIFAIGAIGYWAVGFAFQFGGAGTFATLRAPPRLLPEKPATSSGPGLLPPRQHLRRGHHRHVLLPVGLHGHHGHDPDGRHGRTLEVLRIRRLRLLHLHDHVPHLR